MLRTGLDSFPVELVEEIAWHMPLATLRDFRLSNRRAAAGGYKPLLRFVPTTITCSNLSLSREVSCRNISDLVSPAPIPFISSIISSLTIGRGASKLDLLSQLRLPSLTHFWINQIEIRAAHHTVLFLTNHANTLKSLEIREVDIVCAVTKASQEETLPPEWRAILLTIKELPHVIDFMILDIGYLNHESDARYKIWFHQESILRNERVRSQSSGQYEALIRAKAAQASAQWAVQLISDAVLQSTGKRVFKFQIAY